MANASIQKIAVIGSGVMGGQIAAYLTNAGVNVLLLDIVPEGATDRNVLAKSSIEKWSKADPSPFMHEKNVDLITFGNLDDDFGKLKDVDWIIEVIIEKLQLKSDLYKRIDAIRKPGSVVSSNTSTIPLAKLIEGQSDQFARDMMITHFFNPLRNMRLLELVTGPKTRKDAVEFISDFCDRRLGKGVVPCKDTPGFIANRLGMFFMQSAINATLDIGISVTDADAICGKPMGIPGTAAFGLIDLIGLDLFPLIAKSLMSTLPADDVFSQTYREPPLFQKMIGEGYTGRKGKGGFYRMNKTAEGKVKEAINLQTGEYSPSGKVKLPTLEAAGKNLRTLCDTKDDVGNFAWRVLSQTLCYSAALVPQIADDIVAVDAAMRLGYNWQYGPFQLIDRVGVDWLIVRLMAEGSPIPEFLQKARGKSFYRENEGQAEYLTVKGEYAPIPRAEGVLVLSDIKRVSAPIIKNDAASLWDIGDGVVCLEFHTKMNAIGTDTFSMIKRTISTIGSDMRRDGGKWLGLVIYNEADNFSAGADLNVFLSAVKASSWDSIEDLLKLGGESYRALRFAPFPTVAAPAGLALGGGCEVVLHSSAVQAYAETYIGLVEVGVGLVPAWGGCAQMLARANVARQQFGSQVPPANQAFETIGMTKKSKSAKEAIDLQYLRPTDGISMNRDRLLYDAKQRVIDLAKGYTPPEPKQLAWSGAVGIAALELALEGMKQMSKLSPHDLTACRALETVLCGGEGDPVGFISEEKVMEAERREFMRLIKTPETIARIESMLSTGKRLNN